MSAYVAFLCLVTHNYAEAVVLEEQVKFDIPNRWILSNIKSSKIILEYKVKPRGEYFYRDYYYDTPDFAIYKLGYSYRFRIRDKGEGSVEYGIQFKREYSADKAEDFGRMEIDDTLPRQQALAILGGKWSNAFSDAHDCKTVTAFRNFLERHKIDPRSVAPVLYAEQQRTRLSLKEDNKLRFETSLDNCTLTMIQNRDKKPVHFIQMEIENKYREGTTADIQKRTHELIKYFTEQYRLKLNRESKYKSAVATFLNK